MAGKAAARMVGRASAARAALRVLPLARSVEGPDAIMMPIFRATAIARLAAKYPSHTIAFASAAASAAPAASRPPPPPPLPTSPPTRPPRPPRPLLRPLPRLLLRPPLPPTPSPPPRAPPPSAPTLPPPPPPRMMSQRLNKRALTTEQLARAPLWSALPPPGVGGA